MSDITISLGQAGIVLVIFVGFAIFVFLFHCIVFMKNATESIKSANKILKDVEVISQAASRTTVEAEKVVGDLSQSVSVFTDAIRGNQSIIAAITSVINACVSLKNLLTKSDESDQ